MGQGSAHPGRHAARGVTFLEIVFATVILGLTVATMASTVGAVRAQQDRSEHLLACAELANRLVIQYIDDRTALPPEYLPLTYGDTEYRWRMAVTRVESTLDPTVLRNLEQFENRQAGSNPADRLTKVTITVWVGEGSGGSQFPDRGAPQVTTVRLVDPLGLALRTPDSVRGRLLNSFEDVVQQIMGQDQFLQDEEPEQ